MYTFAEQLHIVRSLRIKENQEKRMDCPFCGGNYTFGISRKDGKLKWGCFRASCLVKGIIEIDRSVASIKNKTIENASRPLPSPLVSVSKHTSILAWLKSVNSLAAYEARLADIRYCPTEDRVMFMMGSAGCLGRSLNNQKPKWRKYGDVSGLFTCGLGPIGVIVEDAPSACAVGIIPEYTGISLNGTKLTLRHKQELRAFKDVFVCLDPDAASLGLEFVKRLDGVTNPRLRIIRDDLKYYDPEKIQQMLHKVIS